MQLLCPMDAELFCFMVNAVKQRMIEVIDDETDGDPESSGQLAAWIVGDLIAQFSAGNGGPTLARIVNHWLSLQPSPWRLVVEQ
jgi:hypothetical protein